MKEVLAAKSEEILPQKAQKTQKGKNKSWNAVLVHCYGLVFVCHWLFQCDVKCMLHRNKDTGRASGTPFQFLDVTELPFVTFVPLVAKSLRSSFACSCTFSRLKRRSQKSG